MIGDFNAEKSEPCLSQFLFEMNPKNIVKEPICQKRLSNPSCIDLVITNKTKFSKYQGNIDWVIGFSQNDCKCFKTNLSKIFP